MLRRTVLGAAAAAPLLKAGVSFAAIQQSSVNFPVPAGACDCHIHIIPEPERYPFWAGRTYTPEVSSVSASIAVHRAIGIDRAVIVHPSFYGADMRATMYGLKELGAAARAVAVIDDKTTTRELDDMHRAGVRGVRLNFQTFAMAGQPTDVEAARRLFHKTLAQIQGRPWHIQLFTNMAVIEALQDDIRSSPLPVSVDHFGMAPATLGIQQTGFPTLLSLVKAGKTYVKISGAYRVSSLPNDYSDVAPLAKALISANPKRILWGSDWPHPPGVAPPGHSPTVPAAMLDIDNARLLNLVGLWAPDAALRKAILVDNPRQLYDF